MCKAPGLLGAMCVTECNRMLQNFCDFRRFLTLFLPFFGLRDQALPTRANRTNFDYFRCRGACYRTTKCNCNNLTLILVNVYRGFLNRVTVTDKNSKNFFFEDDNNRKERRGRKRAACEGVAVCAKKFLKMKCNSNPVTRPVWGGVVTNLAGGGR
jgi:hypothetical protein